MLCIQVLAHMRSVRGRNKSLVNAKLDAMFAKGGNRCRARPQTLNPKPQTPNPKPQTLNLGTARTP